MNYLILLPIQARLFIIFLLFSSSESSNSENYKRLREDMQAYNEILQQQSATSQLQNSHISHQINQLTRFINLLLQYQGLPMLSLPPLNRPPPPLNRPPPPPSLFSPAHLNATVAQHGQGQAPTGTEAPFPYDIQTSESDQTLDNRSILVTSTRLLVEQIPPEFKQKIQSNKYLDFQELLHLELGYFAHGQFAHGHNSPINNSPINIAFS